MFFLQVERALKLISTGTITIELILNAPKGKLPNLPRNLNESTGKQSTLSTGFNEVNWGARCWAYAKSAQSLSASRFDEICHLASEYMKTTSCVTDENDTHDTFDDDDDGVRANIVDNSTSEDDIDGDDSEYNCKPVLIVKMASILIRLYLF